MPHLLRDLRVVPLLLLTAGIGLASGATPTTVTIAASANPVVYGQPVSVTATVSPSSATGKVTFYDGTTVLGVSPVPGGQAALTTSLLASGARALKARYDGDATYAASASAVVTETVTTIPGNGFVAGGSFGTGMLPQAAAVGDFNGDGKADLAVVTGANTVSVLLSNGDGTFQTAVNYATGNYPTSIAVGDFNGDGKADLAVGNQTDSTVSVLLGYGDGTFQGATNFAVFGAVSALAAADFNGDGIIDLAVTSVENIHTLGELDILIGNGDGTFRAAVTYSPESSFTSVAVGDFNADGVPDVAVGGAGGINIFTGVGDGTFQFAVSYLPLASLTAVAAGDINGDGKIDLALANKTDNSLTVLLGNGDGTFQAGVDYGAGFGPVSVMFGDFNGDGKTDIAVTNSLSPNVSVLLGNGDGTFSTAMTYGVSTPSSGATGDFNGDGVSDIATVNYSGNSVGILLGKVMLGASALPASSVSLSSNLFRLVYGQALALTAAVSPTEATGLVTFYDGTTVLGSAPLSGGSATLTTTSLGGAGNHALKAYYAGDPSHAPSSSATIPQFVIAFETNGYGTEPRVNLLENTTRPIIALGDFNGDGKIDMAVTNFTNTISVYLGNGDGTFQAGVEYGGMAMPLSIVAADFNEDGKIDLAVTNAGVGTPGFVAVLLGNGDGTFQPLKTFSGLTDPYAVAVGDFNSDGKPDLVIAGGGLNSLFSDNTTVLFGNGDGTFSLLEYLSAGNGDNLSAAVGDFNGDGNADIVTSSSGPTSSVSVFLGDGKGAFQPALNAATGPQPTSIVVADFNRDGKADIVTANSDSIGAGISVLLGNGDGTFQPAANYAVGQLPTTLVSGDFNGDGVPDLAIADQYGNCVIVLIGKGDGTFQPGTAFSVGFQPVYIAIGDLNSDGKADFITSNAGDGTLSVLLGQTNGAEISAVTLTSSANPSIAGQDINLTATVKPATLVGYVQFMDGENTLGSALLNGGSISLAVSTLSPGSHFLTANYEGFAFVSTSFASLTQQVNDCATVSSGGLTVTSAGGQLPLNVSAPASCSWTIAADSSWITLAPSAGTGNATVTVTIASNATGVDRSGNVLFDLQTVPVTERSSTQVYQDVSPADYYFDAVDLLSTKGITNGCSAGLYCPSQAVTRAEMAVFLVRSVIGLNTFTYSPTPYFADTPPSSFGFAYIQKLYELGLTDGCSNGDYCPNDTVTRDQMAVFIMRMRYGPATVYDYPEDPYFADVSFDAFGFGAVQRMKTDNITSGCAATLYCPSEPVIRGDMAIFVMRGAFNQLLPANEPVISAVSQQSITHGTSAVLTITGIGTHFVQGTTVVNPVAGLAFGTVTVTNATSLSVNVMAGPAPQADPAAIWVTTGTEEAVLPNAVTIQ